MRERKYHLPDTAVPRATPHNQLPGVRSLGTELGHAPVHPTGLKGAINHGCLLDAFEIFFLPTLQICAIV